MAWVRLCRCRGSACTFPSVPQVPEAWQCGTGVHVQAWIVLLSADLLGEFARGPGALWHAGCYPAFRARRSLRRPAAHFFLVKYAPLLAPFSIDLPHGRHLRRNGNERKRRGERSVLPDSSATFNSCAPTKLRIETFVLLIQKLAVLPVTGAPNDRNYPRAVKVDGKARGPLSRRIHDRTSVWKHWDSRLGFSTTRQGVQVSHSCFSCWPSSFGGRTKMPNPSQLMP